MISADGQHLQGWITSQNVLQAVARHMHAAPAAPPASRAAGLAVPIPHAAADQPPDPLRGYQILEITISAGSPANGHALGDTTWPPGWIPVTILDNHTLRDPDPGITLTPGNRVNLLAREPHTPQPAHPHDQPGSHPDGSPPPQIRRQPHQHPLLHPASSPHGRTPARYRAAASTTLGNVRPGETRVKPIVIRSAPSLLRTEEMRPINAVTGRDSLLRMA